MAEEHREQAVSVNESEGEVKDRGLFDFLGKKQTEEKQQPEEEYLSAGVQHIYIEEGDKAQESKEKEEGKHLHEFFDRSEEKEKEEEKHHGVLDKLHRSHSTSSSSSSSDEEVEVEGEGGIKEKIKKKKKKKALEETIESKLHGGEEHREEEKKLQYQPLEEPEPEPKLVVEELELHESALPVEEVEKKGLLERIKDKLPGHGKKPGEESVPVQHAEAVETAGEHGKVHEVPEGPEGKEKKGFLGKIMDKLPGYHKTTGEEGDKSPASH